MTKKNELQKTDQSGAIVVESAVVGSVAFTDVTVSYLQDRVDEEIAKLNDQRKNAWKDLDTIIDERVAEIKLEHADGLEYPELIAAYELVEGVDMAEVKRVVSIKGAGSNNVTTEVNLVVRITRDDGDERTTMTTLLSVYGDEVIEKAHANFNAVEDELQGKQMRLKSLVLPENLHRTRARLNANAMREAAAKTEAGRQLLAESDGMVSEQIERILGEA